MITDAVFRVFLWALLDQPSFGDNFPCEGISCSFDRLI